MAPTARLVVEALGEALVAEDTPPPPPWIAPLPLLLMPAKAGMCSVPWLLTLFMGDSNWC